MATTARARGVDLGGIRRDEDDVDVARVVDLLGAVLSHGDHGEAVLGPGERDGACEDPVGDVRERPRDLLEAVQADQVPGGDSEQGQLLSPDEVVDVRRSGGVPAEPVGRALATVARTSRAAGSVTINLDKERLAAATAANVAARSGSVASRSRDAGKAPASWSATSRTVSGAAQARTISSGSCGDGIGGGVLSLKATASTPPAPGAAPRPTGGSPAVPPGRSPGPSVALSRWRACALLCASWT